MQAPGEKKQVVVAVGMTEGTSENVADVRMSRMVFLPSTVHRICFFSMLRSKVCLRSECSKFYNSLAMADGRLMQLY